MATRFDFESIYDETNWIVLYPNAQGYQEKFYDFCNDKMMKSEFPNVETDIQEFESGGIFFNIEKTKMLAASFKKSQFKKLGVFFRAQQFGNVVFYSMLKTCDKGFWDTVKGRGVDEVLASIRLKCKNLAQWEEFQALNSLGDLVFREALELLDPAWKENKHLYKVE